MGSCVGFLPHNWFPSKIFMGDSGAMLIGLLFAAAGIVSTGQITSGLYDRANGISTVIPILLPFAVLFLPLLDLGLAVIRRTAKGAHPGPRTAATSTTSFWTSATRTGPPSS